MLSDAPPLQLLPFPLGRIGQYSSFEAAAGCPALQLEMCKHFMEVSNKVMERVPPAARKGQLKTDMLQVASIEFKDGLKCCNDSFASECPTA